MKIYVVGTQMNRLTETVHLCTNNIYFGQAVREISQKYANWFGDQLRTFNKAWKPACHDIFLIFRQLNP